MTAAPSFFQHTFDSIYKGIGGLDQYLSSFSSSWPSFLGGSSASRTFNWQRTWDAGTNQARIIRQIFTEAAEANPYSFFKDKQFNEIALTCKDSSSWWNPLSSLTGNTLQDCSIELIQSTGQRTSYSVSNLLNAPSMDPKSDDFSLIRALKLLTTGNGSISSTQSFIAGDSHQEVLNQLGFEELRTSGLGGRFSAIYTSVVNTKLQNVWSFFYPAATEEEISQVGSYFSSNDSTLSTTCQVFSSDPNSMDCSHQLESSSGSILETLKVYNHPGVKEVYTQNGEAANSWSQALHKLGLVSTSSTSTVSNGLQNGEERKLSIYPTLMSRLPSFKAWTMPSTTSWLSALFVPAGIGITLGGLYYAKQCYYDTSKTNIRKTVGLVTGISAAFFGIACAASPFGAFST